MLREQGGGLIMQFSSMGGRVGGSPGIASYQAAKFAIDGFSRVLRAETAPFGVKVMVVEPSGFRDRLGRVVDDRPRDPGRATPRPSAAIERRLRQTPAVARATPTARPRYSSRSRSAATFPHTCPSA